QGRLAIDLPAVHAVLLARRAEMRVAAPVLDPAEKQSRAVGEQGGAGVENAVNRVGPIDAGEDRVGGVALKKLLMSSRSHGLVSFSSPLMTFSARRISSSESRKARVDSAP